ncbi:MAG: bifunctional diaminohydroxyphosphoribosylaminopyrimidine deaminase/5-amino-6-(5-phosphoribosylamino)uracil reductase RibD [Myxococcales bacterium]|nr:bifunctional diaminohydroxyphosphoribosylaminopyrimidine deaminase/5-amino-6-(5-phosphoribosylamino)uracil reductase RibD [Myxococcales bacterium]
MTAEPRFMARALELRAAATHRTSPNPLVGCVVVREGRIVGEGVTQRTGHAHAEVMAILAAGEAARGADVYVTLEPCCHHGRTPPCTDALIAAGVARVFAGVVDPNPLVAGRGMKQLADAGVETAWGPLSSDCARAIAPFERFILDRRSWVTLKVATSLDGRIATPSGESKWLTGPAARADVHALRARADAVLVGAATVLADDPSLTVREAPGNDPVRVVLDPLLRTPSTAKVLGPLAIVFCRAEAEVHRRDAIAESGARVENVPGDGFGGLHLPSVLERLAALGHVLVVVEGGGRLHGALLEARCADELCQYVAPVIIGEGRPAFALKTLTSLTSAVRLDDVEFTALAEDVRIRGRIRYPSPQCSPDSSSAVGSFFVA